MPDSTIQCSLQACTRTTRDFSCSSHYLWLRAQVLRALERRAIRNRLADYSVGMASFTNANAYAQCHRRVLWLRGYQRARAAYLGRARAPASLVQHLSRAHPYLACGKDKGEKRGVNRAPCVCTHEVRLPGFERAQWSDWGTLICNWPRLARHEDGLSRTGAAGGPLLPEWVATISRSTRSSALVHRRAELATRADIWLQPLCGPGCCLEVARNSQKNEHSLSLSLCKREKRCSASCSTEQSRRAALVVYVTTSERRAILM